MNTKAVSRPVTGNVPLLSGLFVVVWSSAWIAGKSGLAYTGPFTLLTLRFAAAALVFLAITIATRAPWPRRPSEYLHLIVVGVFLQAVTLGGMYAGMWLGVSPGTSALMTGVAPLLTAFGAGPFLGERVTRRQWISLIVGLAGVGLVVADKVGFGHADWRGYFWSMLALLSFVGATLYQKRFSVGMDLRTGNFIQSAAALPVVLVAAVFIEGLHARWTGPLIDAVAWMALVNSVGGMTLLFALLKRGSASSVASLFYLIPPVTALMAWGFFHEAPGITAIIGCLIVAASVYFGTRSAQPIAEQAVTSPDAEAVSVSDAGQRPSEIRPARGGLREGRAVGCS